MDWEFGESPGRINRTSKFRIISMLFRNIALGLSNVGLIVGGIGILSTGSYLACRKLTAPSEIDIIDPTDQYVKIAFKASLACLGVGLALRIPSIFSPNPRNLFPTPPVSLCLEDISSFSASNAKWSTPSKELIDGLGRLMTAFQKRELAALVQSTRVKIYQDTKYFVIPARLTVAEKEIEIGLLIYNPNDEVRSYLMLGNTDAQILKNYFTIGDAVRNYATSERNRDFYKGLLFSKESTLKEILLGTTTDSFHLAQVDHSSRIKGFGILIKDNCPLEENIKSEFFYILRDHLQLKFATI